MLRISKPLLNLTIALTGIAVALLSLEMLARFLPTPYDGSSNSADIASYQTGWRGKPYFTTTVATGHYVHDLVLNSRGMHDTEHQLSKTDGVYRILILGDSFVQAVQVREADTAHQILEDRLNKEWSFPTFEVISAGVGGWGTGQQLLYYRAEGRDYQPDLVILMLFLGNDVKDNLPGRGITANGLNHYSPYFVLTGAGLDPAPWLHAPGLAPVTGEYSTGRKVLNSFLGKLYQSSRLYAQIEPLLATAPVEASMLDFYLNNNGKFDYGLALTLALVKQLRTEVEQDGAEFGVVLISPMELIDFLRMSPAEREEIYARIPGLRRAKEIPPPNQHLAKQLTQNGIRVLDLYPLFYQHLEVTGEPLYFEVDKHWNSAGNRLAGEAIYEWLREQMEWE